MATAQHFNSMAEAIEFLEGNERYSVERLSRTGEASFHGPDWRNAKRLALAGWEGGAAQIQKVRATLTLPSMNTQGMVHDVSGFAPDVDRFLAGEPECMYSFSDEEQTRRTVRILTNCGVSCSITHKTIATRGAMIAALIDALESRNVRVELDVVPYCANAGGDDEKTMGDYCVVRIKDAAQPLDLERLAFALLNPAMCRRFGFAYHEVATKGHPFASYGRPTSAPADGYDIVCTHIRHDDDSPRARAWIMQQLAAQGIQIEE